MRRLLLVKYAPEIFLKGLNRGKFEKKLNNNIKNVLKDVDYEFVLDQGRVFLYAQDIEDLVNRVKRVFGVSEVCLVTEVEATLEAIQEQALVEFNESNAESFKIVTNRANKKFTMNSMEVSRNCWCLCV